MDSATESSLLAKLQSGDLTDIHHHFSSYLHPFSAVLTPTIPVKKSKKQSKASEDDLKSTLRSLAKKFLPFLNRTLSLVPKRLSETPQIDSQYALQLFDIYKLGLSCLDSISSQLACKPYTVQLQRVRLVRCYVTWGRYVDAQTEGLFVLESLRGIISGNLGTKVGKLKGRIVPEIGIDDVDQDLAVSIVDVVVSLVKCVALNQSKEEDDYRRILSMVDEIRPWSRVIDANACDKYHRGLVTYLSKCTSLLVGELARFDGNLVHEFCLMTFSEFAKSSMKDQMNKFARRICCSMFSQQDNGLLCNVDIVICILDSMASECKIGLENIIVGFLELVCDCARRCRTATADFCGAVAAHFKKLADGFSQVHLSPIDLITRLYAIGLFILDSYGQSRRCDSTVPKTEKDMSIAGFLLNEEYRLQNLSVTLGSLKDHYNISAVEIHLLRNAEFKNLVPQGHSLMEFNHEAFVSTQTGRTCMASYFRALEFLCKPLSDFINSERKEVLAGLEGVSVPIKLSCIQDAFHHFSCVFLSYCASEREKDIYDDCNRTVLTVAAAAFTLSFTTKQNVKESINFLRHIISADWIQADGLKFLFVSLYNVGVVLYKTNRLKEASKALKLGCKAAWGRVLYLCKMFVENGDRCHSDLSEDAISGFVTEACAKSAFLLDVLYQCGSPKVDRIVRDCLECWSVAGNLFNKIPSPIALVKQWVRIECRLSKDVDVEQRTTTLYSLLSSSTKVSKKALGILLEQELQAYTEMESLNPELCKRIQTAIISILLQEIYITKDSCLLKSRILIAKGRQSRACGVEGLSDSVKYLSEAISTMNELCHETYSGSDQVRHQLADAYCLRALCTQEAEPNSKQLIPDIRKALELWSSPDHCHSADQAPALSQNKFILLSHVADLLSMKGYMEFHSDIYEMMIRLFTWKNVPLEKYLAMLWQSRRLGHALCASPVNDVFIMTLSKHCKLSKSMKFWISCMETSQALKAGFQQSFSFMLTSFSSGSNHDHAIRPVITIDEVKQAASDLITSVPLSSSSVFLAACLYYDLGERLIADGLLNEALFYAKEAHRLRSRLFQDKFMHSTEQQNEIFNENGELIQKCRYNLKNFHMHPSVATVAWSYDNATSHFEDCVLTAWNVLQCYLESTLQMGNVHEMVGNGSEAETHLLWGKNISCFQGLTLFVVSFSAVLGKLYRKQRHWVLAEKELESAKQMLADNYSLISCLKCRLVLEVTVDQQLGDLSRNRSYSGNYTYEGLSCAEHTYRSAIDKLNLSEWKNCVSNTEEASASSTFFCDFLLKVGNDASNSVSHCATNHAERKFPSKVGGQETINKPKVSRKNKKAAKPLPQEQETNMRMTRSRFLSSQKRSEYVPNDEQNGFTKDSTINHVYVCHDALGEKGSHPEVGCSVADCGCEVTCVCDEIKCWHCLPLEVMKSGSLKNFIWMKWEFCRRQLLLRLLTGIGKCLGARSEIHKAHKIFSESISVLVSRSTFRPTYFSVPFTFLLDLIGKNVFGDLFAVEHASILYNICWVSLKSFRGNGTRDNYCDLSCIPMPKIVSWLKLAFIRCREVPVLFQKVSRLLAVLYTLSTSLEEFSLAFSSGEALSESQWASYFHQASLGTHLNHQLFSRIEKQKVQSSIDVEGSCLSSLVSLSLLRLAPESLQDLEGFVLNFFQGLPCSTIICISMLGEAYATLLRELFFYTPSICAWIMLSRLNSNGQPVVIVLPVNSISEGSDDDEDSSSESLFELKNPVKPWRCPWGSTVIDDVAPVFKVILEENYISSAAFPLDDTKENRLLWWVWRRKLDQRLGKFLRDLEASWFGPWRYLFLGDWSDCKHLDYVQKKLMGDLKSECKVDVPESILKVIIGGAKHACQIEECLSKLVFQKGCHIGGIECCNDEGSGSFSNKRDGIENLSLSVCKLILEAIHDIEEEDYLSREPVILVLDFDVQMLPWENLPVLRNQEVYRMPSIASISSTFDKCCQREEKVGKNSSVFPVIDPLDAYYLLNPSGDLSSTEVEFENWFRDQNLEGRTGSAPTIEELTVALKSHDLFMYFGHGSGAQYIPGHVVQKLDKCAATLLMGCSSGSLSLDGSYTPRGAPLYYLLAGSPIIVANLWEVTDKDIDRFSKAMLNAWLRERSTTSANCAQCKEITDKIKTMNINSTKGNGRKKASKKKLSEDCEVHTCNQCSKSRPKIGSFMAQAREACTLPFLIGASPVCYGVPTGIRRKDL